MSQSEIEFNVFKPGSPSSSSEPLLSRTTYDAGQATILRKNRVTFSNINRPVPTVNAPRDSRLDRLYTDTYDSLLSRS